MTPWQTQTTVTYVPKLTCHAALQDAMMTVTRCNIPVVVYAIFLMVHRLMITL